MKEGDKVWLAKYALSGGVTEETVSSVFEGKFCNTIRTGDSYSYGYYIGSEIFPTKQEAINKANEMRDKKIKSLEKQIDKLKKLTF